LEIEQHMAAARVRLFRLAQGEGIPPEAVEDVVQETLLEAWYHLTHLGAPERLDAWLDGICRNMCRRWRRAAHTARRRYVRLPDPSFDGEAHPQTEMVDLADPLALDLVEALSHQDLEYLLDQALAYLPVQARLLVELCYLKELPQRQVALRLGLTVGALEERLRRARRQLRQVLNGELRSAAEALDVPLDTDPLWGWRETREWCNECGKHRLRGTFERAWNGRIALRMRCPACSQRNGLDVVNSKGIVPLEDVRSFRPALKRTYQMMTAAAQHALREQACWRCGGPALVRITDTMQDLETDGDLFWFRVDCPACGKGGMTAEQLLLLHPAMQRFTNQHPRWTLEQTLALDYAGQPALRLQFQDMTGNARLTFLADRQTMQVLATFPGEGKYSLMRQSQNDPYGLSPGPLALR
jgi:RNA polymerase sigma factor (sigma-70 family)